jgi:hypothetical protein
MPASAAWLAVAVGTTESDGAVPPDDGTGAEQAATAVMIVMTAAAARVSIVDRVRSRPPVRCRLWITPGTDVEKTPTAGEPHR